MLFHVLATGNTKATNLLFLSEEFILRKWELGFSQYLAALPDWFILSRVIKNRKFVGSKQRIKKMEIMKICVRIL